MKCVTCDNVADGLVTLERVGEAFDVPMCEFCYAKITAKQTKLQNK